MKKKNINRVMMIIVSLLLALVLLSASFVSSIYARYVVRDGSKFEIEMTDFGIQVGVELSEEFKTRANKTFAAVKDSNSLVVEVGNLTLRPGDDFSDAIKFSFGGQATVPVNVKIAVEIIPSTVAGEDFTVPAGVAGVNSDRVLVPYRFVLGCCSGVTDGVDVVSYTTIADINDGHSSVSVAGKIKNFFGDMTTSGSFACKRFDANTSILLNKKNTDFKRDYFYMGISWPASGTYRNTNNALYSGYTTSDGYDEICAWLTQNKNPKLTVKYIVIVEQANN